MEIVNTSALKRANKLVKQTNSLLAPIRKAVADIALQIGKIEESEQELTTEKVSIEVGLSELYAQKESLSTYQNKLEELLK